jgi:hypothetical protein
MDKRYTVTVAVVDQETNGQTFSLTMPDLALEDVQLPDSVTPGISAIARLLCSL